MRIGLMKADAVGILLLAGISAGAWFGVFQPSLNARATQGSLREQISTNAEDLVAMDRSVRERRKELAGVTSAYADQRVMLEPITAVNTRQTRIRQTAESAGLKVASLRNGEPAGKQKFPRVPITMTGSGQARSILGFLNTLHSDFRDTSVIGFEIEAQPFAPQELPRFTASINWFIDPNSVAAPAKPGSTSTASADSAGAER